MNRGDVILVRFPHPAVVVQSDRYAGALGTLVVAEVTKNLAMASDPACLFVDTSTADGSATGLVRNSVVTCLVLVTVYTNNVAQVLGALSPSMQRKLVDCLKAALGLPLRAANRSGWKADLRLAWRDVREV